MITALAAVEAPADESPAGVAPAIPGAGVRRPRSKVLRRALHYATLIAILVITTLPLYWMVVTSLRGTGESVFGAVSPWPQQLSLDAYFRVFDSIPVAQYMLNTSVVVVLSVVSEIVLSSFAGYALSRSGWRGRKVALGLVLVALLFPFEAIMVSLFVMVDGLGLIDTLIGVWLPGLVGPVNILIMRAAFLSVPDEIEEAAVLDGAHEWGRFWHVFLPSAKGALTVVAITTFIATWDAFLWPLLVLRQDANYTLTLGLAQLSNSEFGFDQRMVMAGAIVSIVPVLIIFGFAQKYFFRGVGDGALKF